MTNKSRKEELMEEELPSWFVLTKIASSTALPGKAKPGMSIWLEALHKTLRSSWGTNIITGIASLVGGAWAVSVWSLTENIIETAVQGVGLGLLTGGLLFLIGYSIALLYVRVTPPER